MSPAATTNKPSKLRIRSYQVGFGDCFLLTFYYPKAKKPADKERHILIDFGSTGMPEDAPPDQMMRVARDIESECGGKLHVIVATHRHKDHISGFSTNKDGDGTGDVIAGLAPDVIIQPWTEEPEALDPKPAKGKAAGSKKALKALAVDAGGTPDARALSALHVASLASMHKISDAMLTEVRHLTDENRFTQRLGPAVAGQIAFLANDNGLPNRSAVENLATMAKKHKGGQNHYVHHGYPLKLSKLLPGVKVNVLGPPTLEQHAEIRKQRSADKNEFWMLQAASRQFWGLQAAAGELVTEFSSGKGGLFPGAKIYKKFFPSHDRWFIRQLRAMRGSQMLSLVRILDEAMNNTSVILLFEVGGKKLLFSGDAQIENWEYALKRAGKNDLELLKGVDVYKVGHHGSRNATPKTLWESFDRRSDSPGAADRLKTIVSTMPGKHGTKKNHSEVPRETLVDALKSQSEYHTTETAAERGELYEDLTITFPK